MGEWVDGAERIPITGAAGLTFNTDAPWRIVLHTTEGDTVEGAVQVYRSKLCPPHFTVDPTNRRVTQHIPMNLGAYALSNVAGGVETNRVPSTQIEIVGCAAQSPDWSDAKLDWLGTAVIAPIIDYTGCELKSSVTFQGNWSPLPTLSFTEWLAYSGILGHQHVPENKDSHWDPGELNVYRVMRAAALKLLGDHPPVPTVPQILGEDDMKLLCVTDDPAKAILLLSAAKGLQWVFNGNSAGALMKHMPLEDTTVQEVKFMLMTVGATGQSPNDGALLRAW